jgi:hypothetical protein
VTIAVPILQPIHVPRCDEVAPLLFVAVSADADQHELIGGIFLGQPLNRLLKNPDSAFCFSVGG